MTKMTIIMPFKSMKNFREYTVVYFNKRNKFLYDLLFNL
jgi:hypothetical protein